MARPTIYTKTLGDKICKRLSDGESVRSIDKDDKMPNGSTIYAWLLDGKHEEFSKRYALARNIQTEKMFEEINELADMSIDDIVGDDKSDGARVQARKLQVDARRWTLSKMRPMKYGDKLDLTSDGKQLPAPILGGIANKDGKVPKHDGS